MEKTLKTISLKRVIPRILACVILAAILLGVTGLGIFSLLGGATAISALNPQEAEGRYVSMEANSILAAFATYTVNDAVQKEYFIARLDNGYYIAVCAREDETMDLLEAAGDQAEDYYLNETIEALTSMGSISGTLSALPEELVEYLDSAVESLAPYIPDLQELEDPTTQLLYLSVNVDRIGAFSANAVLLMTLLALLFLALAIVQLALVLSGFYQKKALASIPAEDRQAAEEDFANATQIEHVRVGSLFTWYQKGATSKVLDNRQILWIYGQIEPLVVSKYRWPMCVWTREGQQPGPHLQEQSSIKAIVKAAQAHGNRFLVGYDAARLRQCSTDFAAFVAEAEQALQEM